MATTAQNLYQAMDSCAAALAIIDPKCAILFANAGMLEFLSLPLQEVVGRKCFQLVHGTTEAVQGCPLLTMLKDKSRAELEVNISGTHYKVIAAPITNSTGRILGGLHVMAKTGNQDYSSFLIEPILTRAKDVLMAH